MRNITNEEIQEIQEMYEGTADAWKYWPAFCPQCGWKGLSKDCIEQAHLTKEKTVICPTCYYTVKDVEYLTGDLRYYINR